MWPGRSHCYREMAFRVSDRTLSGIYFCTDAMKFRTHSWVFGTHPSGGISAAGNLQCSVPLLRLTSHLNWPPSQRTRTTSCCVPHQFGKPLLGITCVFETAILEKSLTLSPFRLPLLPSHIPSCLPSRTRESRRSAPVEAFPALSDSRRSANVSSESWLPTPTCDSGGKPGGASGLCKAADIWTFHDRLSLSVRHRPYMLASAMPLLFTSFDTAPASR